jgi:hypothetical protein
MQRTLDYWVFVLSAGGAMYVIKRFIILIIIANTSFVLAQENWYTADYNLSFGSNNDFDFTLNMPTDGSYDYFGINDFNYDNYFTSNYFGNDWTSNTLAQDFNDPMALFSSGQFLNQNSSDVGLEGWVQMTNSDLGTRDFNTDSHIDVRDYGTPYQMTGNEKYLAYTLLENTAEGRSLQIDAMTVLLMISIETKSMSSAQAASSAGILADFIDGHLNKSGASGMSPSESNKLVQTSTALRAFVIQNGQGTLFLPNLDVSVSTNGISTVTNKGNALLINFEKRNDNWFVIEKDERTGIVYSERTIKNVAGINLGISEENSFSGSNSNNFTNYPDVNSSELVGPGYNNQNISRGPSSVAASSENLSSPPDVGGSTLQPIAVDLPVSIGRTIWEKIAGKETVEKMYLSQPEEVVRILEGTSIAVEIFGQAQVELSIIENSELAIKGIKTLDTAKRNGYSNEEIIKFIQEHPSDWFTYGL